MSAGKDKEFRKSIYSAARSLNWFFPQTEEEVAASEDEIEPTDSSGGGDPFEALDREPGFSKRPTFNPDPICKCGHRRGVHMGQSGCVHVIARSTVAMQRYCPCKGFLIREEEVEA